MSSHETKNVNEKFEDASRHGSFSGNNGSSGVGNRNWNDDQNSRRDTPRRYANAIGMIGAGNDSDGDSTASQTETATTTGNRHSHHLHHGRRSHRSRHERKYIRRKLKRKSKVPGHVAWTKWMHSSSKNHCVALIGEFIGTTMFLFFAFAATTTANLGGGDGSFNPSTILYIALSFGFSLMVNAWIFFRISGGLFNPAVTLALLLTRDLGPMRALLVFIAQLTGSCFASYLVSVLLPSGLNVQTTLGANTTIAQGIWIEALCTAGLVFTIIMLAKEKHQATFIAPVGIGMSLFIGELVAVFYTGGSLNPARSFGPAAVAHDFLSDQWVYWVGPAIGSILAFAFYRLMKVLEYEMANPGQDGDERMDPTQNPDHELARVQEERQAEVEEILAIEEEGGFENMAEDVPSIASSFMTDEGTNGMMTASISSRSERELQAVAVHRRSSQQEFEVKPVHGRRIQSDLEAQRDFEPHAVDVDRGLSASLYLHKIRSNRWDRSS